MAATEIGRLRFFQPKERFQARADKKPEVRWPHQFRTANEALDYLHEKWNPVVAFVETYLSQPSLAQLLEENPAIKKEAQALVGTKDDEASNIVSLLIGSVLEAQAEIALFNTVWHADRACEAMNARLKWLTGQFVPKFIESAHPAIDLSPAEWAEKVITGEFKPSMAAANGLHTQLTELLRETTQILAACENKYPSAGWLEALRADVLYISTLHSKLSLKLIELRNPPVEAAALPDDTSTTSVRTALPVKTIDPSQLLKEMKTSPYAKNFKYYELDRTFFSRGERLLNTGGEWNIYIPCPTGAEQIQYVWDVIAATIQNTYPDLEITVEVPLPPQGGSELGNWFVVRANGRILRPLAEALAQNLREANFPEQPVRPNYSAVVPGSQALYYKEVPWWGTAEENDPRLEITREVESKLGSGRDPERLASEIARTRLASGYNQGPDHLLGHSDPFEFGFAAGAYQAEKLVVSDPHGRYTFSTDSAGTKQEDAFYQRSEPRQDWFVGLVADGVLNGGETVSHVLAKSLGRNLEAGLSFDEALDRAEADALLKTPNKNAYASYTAVEIHGQHIKIRYRGDVVVYLVQKVNGVYRRLQLNDLHLAGWASSIAAGKAAGKSQIRADFGRLYSASHSGETSGLMLNAVGLQFIGPETRSLPEPGFVEFPGRDEVGEPLLLEAGATLYICTGVKKIPQHEFERITESDATPEKKAIALTEAALRVKERLASDEDITVGVIVV